MSRKQSAISNDYDRPTLTRSQVAKQLNKSYRHIQRLVAKNYLRETRLPSARGSRSIPCYSQAAVDAYLGSGYAR